MNKTALEGLSPDVQKIMKTLEKQAKDDWDKTTDPFLIQQGYDPQSRHILRETHVQGFMQGGAAVYLFLKGAGRLKEARDGR